MKQKNLKRAILLGLAMSVTAYSMGMAAEIPGPIKDNSHNGNYQEEVTIKNGNSDLAAIQIGHESSDPTDVEIAISTTGENDIKLDSEGYGIRTEKKSTGTILLNSSKDNVIQFGSGSGISNNSNGTGSDNINGVNIKLQADGKNSITYDGKILGNKDDDDHDGINVGANNTGDIELIGAANEIDVKGDGIYTASGSKSNVTLTAEAGNNTITAGNNGIDHRGSGTVTLKADKGGNVITAGEGQTKPEGDGVRIEGNGNVILTGQYNTISAADDGLYIKETSGENASVSVTASGADESTGIGNYIEGNRGIAAEAGKINVTGNGGINWVQADTTGIWAKGAATSITMQGTTSIIVNDGNKTSEDNPTYTDGIYVSDGGKYEVIRDEADKEGKDVSIDVTAHAVNSAGIWAESQGTVDMETKDFHLGIINEAESSPTGGNQVYGIFANQSTVGIDASGSVEIGAQGETLTDYPNVYGIYAATGYQSGNSSESAATFVDTKVEITGTAINITAKNTGGGTFPAAYGVALDKHVSDDRYQDNDQKVEVKLHSTGEEGITIDATAAAGPASGVQVTNVNGLLEITADAGDVSISANGKSVYGSNSNGVYVVSNTIADSQYDVMAKADIRGVNTFITATGAGIGLRAENQKSQIAVTATDGNNTVKSDSIGIYSIQGAQTTVTALKGKNWITATGNAANAQSGGTITLTAGVNQIQTEGTSLYAASGGAITLNAQTEKNWVTSTGTAAYALNGGTIALTGTNGNDVMTTGGSGWGIYSSGTGSNVSSSSTNGANVLTAAGNGIIAYSGGAVDFSADVGDNSVTADSGYAIFASGAAGDSTRISLNAGSDNIVKGSTWGLVASQGQVQLSAKENNQVSGTDDEGIYAYDNASVVLTAGADNFVAAGTITDNFGSKYAVMGIKDSTIRLAAAKQNVISGAVYARGTNDETTSRISLGGLTDEDGIETTKPDNFIYSAAVISDAGDLNTSGNEEMKNKSVISALYAEDGADITVSGQNNIFRTTADPSNPDQLERVIWAYNGADINIDGTTLISTDSYKESPNSADIAIAAGTAVGISESTDFNTLVDRAEVNLNYGAGSSVTGDIIAGYAGEVNISRALDAGDAGIQVEGNLLAGNNGILNVDLGNGGILEGRADDYGDAGVITDSKHTTFFDPAFSSGIYKGGAVNLTMGAGSRWNVTGQSWITRIDTTEAGSAEDSGRAIIDLVSANTERNTYAHALTVYDMKGDAVFNMSLNGDRTLSDMLYMKHAEGSYIINVIDAVTTDDMYAGNFDGLRFATVGDGSKVSFRAVTVDQGALNVEYEVGTDAYEGNTENGAYNSADGSGNGNEEKPGTEMVDGFFESTGTPVDEPQATRAAVLAAEDEETGSQLDNVQGTTNYKLIAVKDTQISHAGQTIIDMSKVNYSNAVYMDRLNKRMGEARYLDGDDGLWVRLRHDRIGKDNAFRSMNTMMELGYDWKAKGQKDGEHRQGVVFDYMRGTADYTNVMGDGDVRRAGVWLYDTWLGDKGHYTDYVVKYGHLSNDFDIYAPTTLEEINGDYSNDVWSVSAEYGRKKDIGNEWYIEPQAQMQYAYVTSADYTTSQGTKVELDGIDSLIGRAGFRLGRDTSEGNTVYFKADILHEFLGDQSIRAMDSTGVLSTTYENEGTWYDVGFGFSHRMGKDSYMFLDLERSFGNDNDETYQINIGLSKAF